MSLKCALFAEFLGQTVDDDGKHNQSQPGYEAGTDFSALQGGKDITAQSRGTDHRSDDDHRQGQHDGLVRCRP